MSTQKFADPFVIDNGTTISSSTDATPIVITTAAAHQLTTGDQVFISGHTTNTNANGLFTITVASATTFSLTGSTATGGGAGSGGVALVPIHLAGYADLRVEGAAVQNSSGGAYTVVIADGPTGEFGDDDFVSIDTATNSVLLTQAQLETLNGARLQGRLFNNNSQSYRIVGQKGRRLFLSGSASLDKDAAWTIDGRTLHTLTGASTDLWKEFNVCSDRPWFGLWVSGTSSNIVLYLMLEDGSKVKVPNTSTGPVGDNDGSNWICVV